MGVRSGRDGNVVSEAQSDSPEKFSETSYELKNGDFADDDSAKAVLIKNGIGFTEGSSVRWSAAAREHTVIHTASKATAHLWIESPLDEEGSGAASKFNRRFDTHPPLEDRIKILKAM